MLCSGRLQHFPYSTPYEPLQIFISMARIWANAATLYHVNFLFNLPSEMTCSGDARLNHSDQDPSYMADPVWPSRWAASATWHAVTPEPQDTQKGRPRSTPASWNSLDRSSGPRCFPEASMKEVKGMLIAPGKWPGSVSGDGRGERKQNSTH